MNWKQLKQEFLRAEAPPRADEPRVAAAWSDFTVALEARTLELRELGIDIRVVHTTEDVDAPTLRVVTVVRGVSSVVVYAHQSSSRFYMMSFFEPHHATEATVIASVHSIADGYTRRSLERGVRVDLDELTVAVLAPLARAIPAVDSATTLRTPVTPADTLVSHPSEEGERRRPI